MTSCSWSVRRLRARCSATEPPFTAATDWLTQSLPDTNAADTALRQTHDALLSHRNLFWSLKRTLSQKGHELSSSRKLLKMKSQQNSFVLQFWLLDFVSCADFTNEYALTTASTAALTNKWRDDFCCSSLCKLIFHAVVKWIEIESLKTQKIPTVMMVRQKDVVIKELKRKKLRNAAVFLRFPHWFLGKVKWKMYLFLIHCHDDITLCSTTYSLIKFTAFRVAIVFFSRLLLKFMVFSVSPKHFRELPEKGPEHVAFNNAFHVFSERTILVVIAMIAL